MDSSQLCARFISSIMFCSHRGEIFGGKSFLGVMPLFTTIHSFRLCGSPETSTFTTIFKKCGVAPNLAWEGKNASP